jgi:deoxyribodipyrimidine photo-lyase
MGVQLVWFKRDLRIRDHAPLAMAARRGPVLGLYVFEPSLLDKVTTDPSHVRFILESLAEVRAAVLERGGDFVVARGELPEALDRLWEARRFEALWSHEETGDLATYARDRRVKRWCRTKGIAWTELPQNGVVRGPHDRDGWSRTWHTRATAPRARVPEAFGPGVSARAASVPGLTAWFSTDDLPSPSELGVAASTKDEAQPGGEAAARETLKSFLYARGRTYRSDLSSPITSWDACSRLSPYLAYGNLSIGQVYQASQRRLRELRHGAGDRPGRGPGSPWLDSLESFESRLRWHCHFIQKLEDEPELEVRNVNRAFDGLRTEDPEDWTPEERARFDAWCEGRTGYPLVDAVMRALHRGGWINFRMRAMLVSFAAHHLWLHWLPLARYLARHFIDYEPGIHFSQFQMQSGTTGINALRIYNPIKQAHDRDPEGRFIRAYVPELARVPDAHVFEPHRMPASLQRQVGCEIGRDYPAPIVEHAAAYRQAQTRHHAWRKRAGMREAASEVLRRHGSRRRQSRR